MVNALVNATFGSKKVDDLIRAKEREEKGTTNSVLKYGTLNRNTTYGCG